MILKLEEIVTLSVSLCIQSGIHLYQVKRRKMNKSEKNIFDRLTERIISIKVEMHQKQITQTVFFFPHDEAVLILEILRMCLLEETRTLEKTGKSANLDCDVGVTLGRRLNKDDFEMLIKRFDDEVYDLENNPKYKIPELNCWK